MIIDEEDFDEMTIEEDIAFSKLADKRLKETKYWIKHEDAWDIPGIVSEHCCVDTQSSLRGSEATWQSRAKVLRLLRRITE